jgi:hypothetical protein
MKLAQALIERADLKARIEQIVKRMKENALVQEGDAPAEDVAKLGVMYDSMMGELEGLIMRINITNHESMICFNDDAISIAEAIAMRDCLKAKIAAYRSVKDASLPKRERYSNSEIKFVRTTDIAKLQDMIDGYSKQYRELDTNIQEANWKVKLL